MHTYAKGDTVDFDDEEGAESWLLWAKSASALCLVTNLTVTCVLNHTAAREELGAPEVYRHRWNSSSLSNDNPQPSPCFALLKTEPNKFVYDKAVTDPTPVHLESDPEECRPPDSATGGNHRGGIAVEIVVHPDEPRAFHDGTLGDGLDEKPEDPRERHRLHRRG